MATNQLHTHMRLLAEVRARGITYLTGMVPARVSTAVAQAPLPVVELLQSLAQCPDVRLRDTVIALLLLHPNLADAVDDARAQVIPQTAEYLATLVLATLYLQRQWYWLLDLSLGHAPSVPETSFAAYWRDRGLPAPALDFGRPGLIALNAAEQQHTGLLVKYSGDWQNQIDHLLYQAWHGRGNTARAVPPAIMPPWSNEEAATMSMRPNVSRTDIERFLRELGRLVQHPGRIYLAGGAALVHYQVRGLQGNTADIDLRLDVTDLNEVENGIRQLKVSLGITIEIASPADFIPLPPTWDEKNPSGYGQRLSNRVE